MEVKGWTLEELAEKLKMSKNATQMRIRREEIEPLFNGSIYPPDTYERIKAKQPGRPKKTLYRPP
jgi:transcriptional regulator with XRE-family HTH domain